MCSLTKELWNLASDRGVWKRDGTTRCGKYVGKGGGFSCVVSIGGKRICMAVGLCRDGEVGKRGVTVLVAFNMVNQDIEERRVEEAFNLKKNVPFS